MKRELLKEMRYALRSGRFLILAVGFAFFSMLTPVMMKWVLPGVMKSQMPGLTDEAMAQMFQMTQIGCIQSYMGDVFEICALLVSFTLCGLMAQELKDNTLVLPLCGGRRLSQIVSAKMLIFGSALLAIPTLALSVNYLYAGILFTFEVGYLPILLGGLMQGLFMVFLLAGLLFFGSLLQKPVASGMITLGMVYVMSIFGGLLKINTWLPTGLMGAAQTLSSTPDAAVLRTALVTAGLIIFFSAASLYRLRHLEWNKR